MTIARFAQVIVVVATIVMVMVELVRTGTTPERVVIVVASALIVIATIACVVTRSPLPPT